MGREANRYRFTRFVAAALLLAAGVPARGEERGPTRFAREMLAAHNAVRAGAGVRALKWSDRLAAHAGEWAEALLEAGEFRHRPQPRYGENLFTITGARSSPVEVVERWAAEARYYDIGANRCRGVCGHYTQLVWAATRRVGCAVARGPNREVWVCNYDPPGNVRGSKPY